MSPETPAHAVLPVGHRRVVCYVWAIVVLHNSDDSVMQYTEVEEKRPGKLVVCQVQAFFESLMGSVSIICERGPSGVTAVHVVMVSCLESSQH